MTIRQMLFTIFIVFLSASCENNHGIHESLASVDSLLSDAKYDSAYKRLTIISKDEINSEKDKAYYNLLETQCLFCLYKPISSDSAINYSIEFYKNKKDKQRLARALYYKGIVFYGDGTEENAIRNIKEAELLARKIGDKFLLNRIYLNLAYLNGNEGNYDTALYYAKKSLSVAVGSNKNNWIGLSLSKISNIYSFMIQSDSAAYYAEQTIPYIKYLSKQELPEVLVNISISLANVGETGRAEYYAMQANKIKPTAEAYSILGAIYLSEGKIDDAELLFDEALESDDPGLRAETMLWMSDVKKEQGLYKEAAELADRASRMKDSMRVAGEHENLLKVQSGVEHSAAERAINLRLLTMASVSGMLVLVIICLFIYHRRRMNKAKKQIVEISGRMERYERRIEELDISGKANEKEIGQLNRKLTTLREKRAEKLGHGRKCYEEVAGGGTTAKWKKYDFEAVVEYCRTLRPETVENIEKGYRRLTAYNTFFLLLHDIGIDDSRVPYVMNMSDGAVRTMRYRLRGKAV